nr:aminotransferase class V-fold PLP-dependent enzyme [Intrasporangium sp.]
MVAAHTADMTALALCAAPDLPEVTVYGPPPEVPRAPVLACQVDGADPMDVARRLDELGVESRAGCHCATLAHRDLGLDPPASCRLSLAMYTSPDDVAQAMDALAAVVHAVRRGR